MLVVSRDLGQGVWIGDQMRVAPQTRSGSRIALEFAIETPVKFACPKFTAEASFSLWVRFSELVILASGIRIFARPAVLNSFISVGIEAPREIRILRDEPFNASRAAAACKVEGSAKEGDEQVE